MNIVYNPSYPKYLELLQEKFDKMFEKQKEYIFCKKGCAKCCLEAEFPYTSLEADYLLAGFNTLDSKTKVKILHNIKKVLKERENSKEEIFYYSCPFLIDNLCSVYNYRGIVCRTFGLLSLTENGKTKIPLCVYDGLNYSNVVDLEKNMITEEKFKKGGFKTPPVGFNINYNFLTDSNFEKAFNITFGPKKPLINWLEEKLEIKENEVKESVRKV